MSGAFESALALIYDVALQRAAVVAGYSLLLYDYFLTLSDEVEYIWNTPRTLVKFIYLANRYIVLLGQTVLCIQVTAHLAVCGCSISRILSPLWPLCVRDRYQIVLGFSISPVW
ncbi:hypothetical protein M404DRAFT_624673 [Pisolithus tinctorius Marx 270]|uniref:DUF6533 domain-containing protein n=1 Tax=Pisolithus tinctorius Marx 270 TaxID=870435 RepID=A0A0C3P7C0_PISTI|nr:hypothetical protein M404DRAFT_624673 [Pisolithus tinctorius Marx 270]